MVDKVADISAKLLDELSKLSEPKPVSEETRLIRALLYGDPGCGKTTMAIHLVKEKGVIVTTDSAWVVVDKYPEQAAKLTRMTYQGFSQLRTIAQAHDLGIEPWASHDTLIWDTASTGIDSTLRKLVDARKYPKEQHDPEVEGWPHYRLAERSLRNTVEVLNASGMHIIYTSHLRDPTAADKEKKRFAIRPAMPEACFKVLAQEVQLLGWMFKESRGSERQVQVEGTLQETAKSQIPTVPETTYKVNELITLMTNWRDHK